MVRHVSFGHLLAHRHAKENLRWNPLHAQGRIVLEAETPIEGRISDQDAALGSQIPNRSQSFVDERLADALALMAWGHGNLCR
jgi:hypothetical protein